MLFVIGGISRNAKTLWHPGCEIAVLAGSHCLDLDAGWKYSVRADHQIDVVQGKARDWPVWFGEVFIDRGFKIEARCLSFLRFGLNSRGQAFPTLWVTRLPSTQRKVGFSGAVTRTSL
jgi:hypothetical protein